MVIFAAEDTTYEQESKRVKRWSFRRFFRRIEETIKEVHNVVHCALFGCARPDPTGKHLFKCTISKFSSGDFKPFVRYA